MPPVFTSGCPNCALRPAMMKSQHMASSLPAPKAMPLTAAMNGFGKLWMAFQASMRFGSLTTLVTPYFCMFLMSAPAEKMVSSPVTTTQRTCTSLRASSRMRAISITIGLLSALRFAGRAMRISTTCGDTRSLEMNFASLSWVSSIVVASFGELRCRRPQPTWFEHRSMPCPQAGSARCRDRSRGRRPSMSARSCFGDRRERRAHLAVRAGPPAASDAYLVRTR